MKYASVLFQDFRENREICKRFVSGFSGKNGLIGYLNRLSSAKEESSALMFQPKINFARGAEEVNSYRRPRKRQDPA